MPPQHHRVAWLLEPDVAAEQRAVLLRMRRRGIAQLQTQGSERIAGQFAAQHQDAGEHLLAQERQQVMRLFRCGSDDRQRLIVLVFQAQRHQWAEVALVVQPDPHRIAEGGGGLHRQTQQAEIAAVLVAAHGQANAVDGKRWQGAADHFDRLSVGNAGQRIVELLDAQALPRQPAFTVDVVLRSEQQQPAKHVGWDVGDGQPVAVS
ncbi:hypothetical protein D3C81_1164790 [compost metagenome]